MCIATFFVSTYVYEFFFVSTYVYEFFLSTYVYEYMIDFIRDNLYLICAATHVYNRFWFYGNFYFTCVKAFIFMTTCTLTYSLIATYMQIWV